MNAGKATPIINCNTSWPALKVNYYKQITNRTQHCDSLAKEHSWCHTLYIFGIEPKLTNSPASSEIPMRIFVLGTDTSVSLRVSLLYEKLRSQPNTGDKRVQGGKRPFLFFSWPRDPWNWEIMESSLHNNLCSGIAVNM